MSPAEIDQAVQDSLVSQGKTWTEFYRYIGSQLDGYHYRAIVNDGAWLGDRAKRNRIAMWLDLPYAEIWEIEDAGPESRNRQADGRSVAIEYARKNHTYLHRDSTAAARIAKAKEPRPPRPVPFVAPAGWEWCAAACGRCA
ncbi:MAG TPA: hypothetical protein PKY30_09570 [Myxococcota bacterium]|nr:hypothetical protein [Myxococcota bacterium]HNH47275.1 hypothetical protein [Myxococcota bacterium]